MLPSAWNVLATPAVTWIEAESVFKFLTYIAVLPFGAPSLPVRVSTQATYVPSGEISVSANRCAARRVLTTASISGLTEVGFSSALRGFSTSDFVSLVCGGEVCAAPASGSAQSRARVGASLLKLVGIGL